MTNKLTKEQIEQARNYLEGQLEFKRLVVEKHSNPLATPIEKLSIPWIETALTALDMAEAQIGEDDDR